MVSNSERLSIELFESGAQCSALLLLLILFVGWNEERSLEAKLKKKLYTPDELIARILGSAAHVKKSED